MRALFIILLLTTSIFTSAQVSDQLTREALEDRKEFVAIPNFGLNAEDIQKNIVWAENAFSDLGFETEILPTKGNPLFFAQKMVDPKLPTILFYMHLDGQAVDSKKWDQPNPYKVVLKSENADGAYQSMPWSSIEQKVDPDWRVFGRAASDDKGPIIAFIAAMKSLQQNKQTPAFNVKLVLDGEEEIGSKSLAAAVVKYRKKLAANALIINDGPLHPSGKPTITFGCRGISIIDMTVYGPVLPQHSGHYLSLIHI